MRGPRLLLAAIFGLGGCHLALGIEEAELIETVGGACSTNAACNDGNACTGDLCEAGACRYELLDGDAPIETQSEGDCERVVCAAGAEDSVADDGDLPIDGLDCTTDGCDGGEPTNIPLAGGTACTQNGGQVCNGDGACVECFSNAECTTPQTCGGGGTVGLCGCTPIACSEVGLTCGFAAQDGCGNPLPCDNDVQDGAETDVDCGGAVGSCATRCAQGLMCLVDTDCASGICDATNQCQAPPPG